MSESSGHHQNAADLSQGYHQVNQSASELYSVLQNARRRRVIAYIHGNEHASVSELAKHIAAQEQDADPSALFSSDYNAIQVGLYQAHLETLDEAGIVDYDDRNGTVTPTVMTAPVYDLMITVRDAEVVTDE